MGSIIQLGKFERVALRDAWPTEDGNFTPWLAEKGNIALLGEALGMELEVEAVEQKVGSFWADILARATDEASHRVIIENQFGRTDHSHLGQMLTYLAGVEDVKTIVWIAEAIQPDHRAAVDWLNTYTAEDFSFFAIEIELWRIGASPPAARFNVVASPNDWTRNTRTAARQVVGTDLAERHKTRMAFWASFGEFLKERGSTFKISKPNKDHWNWFSIGRAGYGISVTISVQKHRVGVELYVVHDVNKAAFKTFYAQKQAIESEIGSALEWQELPGKKASRIALYKYEVDPSDDKQYPQVQAWMIEKMDAFKKAFAARVKAVPLITSSSDDEDDGSPEE